MEFKIKKFKEKEDLELYVNKNKIKKDQIVSITINYGHHNGNAVFQYYLCYYAEL